MTSRSVSFRTPFRSKAAQGVDRVVAARRGGRGGGATVGVSAGGSADSNNGSVQFSNISDLFGTLSDESVGEFHALIPSSDSLLLALTSPFVGATIGLPNCEVEAPASHLAAADERANRVRVISGA